MKIHALGFNYGYNKLNFKSSRTDKNTISMLSKGVKPIGENQKINIINSLNNIVQSPNKADVEFLLNIADNLVYGQGGNSEFKKAIDEDSATLPNRENFDWSDKLEKLILQSISDLPQEESSDLQEQFLQVFGKDRELTKEQEEILALRKQFNQMIVDENSISDDDSVVRTVRVSKNLDYFIASSEISITQKKECLEKFLYILSDNYDIDPQLSDKRLQVVDEMLNDMVIKTPEDDVLTIKDVDQRQSGICAAISIARKALAYEDKTQYMNLVIDELKNSSTMEVYDISELGSDKKVTVPKASIDYDVALSKGYRILDASAHIWMQNAHASGDGSIPTEKYIAFDDETYGVFNDSSWYEGLDVSFSPAKKFLMALIKEKEVLSSVMKRQKVNETIFTQVYSQKRRLLDEQGRIIGLLNDTIASVFPNLNQTDITHLSKDVIAFYTGKSSDNEVNVPTHLDKKIQAQIISEFIQNKNTDMTQEQVQLLNEKSETILDLTATYKQYDSEISRAKSYNTNRSKYRYYKHLFQAAAAHRLAVEADVNMPDGVIRHEKSKHIPPKDVRVSSYLESLQNKFASESFRTQFTDSKGVVPTEKQLSEELAKDIYNIEIGIPTKIDNILKYVTGNDYTGYLLNLYQNISFSIKNGDKEAQTRYANLFEVTDDKNILLERIEKWIDKLSNNPSSQDIQEATRLVGFEDRLSAANLVLTSFFNELKNGISQAQYESIVERIQEKDFTRAFNNSIHEFQQVVEQYEDILETWNVPSSRTVILEKFEKDHTILSRRKLDQLQRSFTKIDSQIVQNSSIKDLKKRAKANESIAKLSPEDMDVINQIDKAVSKMRNYANDSYKSLNTFMFDALEQQYADIGMLNGQFWVREEGSSGLSATEQVRILEQMTGQPYHIERNVQDAVKQIKEGNGSGILSSSVLDNDYAFHAQYIPLVSSETFIDPITKEKTVKDVLWTDNSWGRIEKETYWNGRNGHNYTDYGGGYGWKDGFILDDSFKIGLPVDDMHCATGIESSEQEKFGLVSDVVLPGTPVNAYQKLYNVFSNIFAIGSNDQFLNSLETALSNGYKLDIDYLKALDDIASEKTENLTKRIENEIKSREDFDKLSDDDPIKIVMNKLSLYMATDNPTLRDSVISMESLSEIDNVKESMVAEQIDEFASIIGKSSSNFEDIYEATHSDITALINKVMNRYGMNKLSEKDLSKFYESLFFDSDSLENYSGSLASLQLYFVHRIDELVYPLFSDKEAANYVSEEINKLILGYIGKKIRITSLDHPTLINSPLYHEFIASIDKYLNPKDNKELLQLIGGLQNADFDTVNDFIDALEPNDVGLNFKDPYDYVRRFLAGDSDVNRAFSELVSDYEITKALPTSEDENYYTPEEMYRNLHVKLSDMDVQKFIKNFKNEAFAKYKVRQAFPEPVVFKDSEIEEVVVNVLNSYKEKVDSIDANKSLLNILSKYYKFIDKYENNPIYISLLNGEDVSTEEHKEELITFINDLKVVQDSMAEDESMQNLFIAYNKIISIISSSEERIDGSEIKTLFATINHHFKTWKDSSIDENKFRQNINEELASLRQNMWLFVKANIDPRYQDDAVKQIKSIIDLFKQNADQEEIDFASDNLIDFVLEKHITKNPTVLLEETVKCLQNGDKESDLYQLLKSYLTKALKVAQQTKVQYKLVQNQHDGISTKSKDLLSIFNTVLSDGSKVSIDSNLGMIYLIQKLSNYSDDNVTLNLFLNQSGLSQRALNALIERTIQSDYKKEVSEKAKLIIQSIHDLNRLNDVTSTYFEQSNIKYKSFADAFNQIATYVERKEKKNIESPIIKSFIETVQKLQVPNNGIPLNSELFNQVLASAINDVFEMLSDSINYDIEFIEEVAKQFEAKARLIDAINVPENSKVNEDRTKFLKTYSFTMKEINAIIHNVYREVEKTQ